MCDILIRVESSAGPANMDAADEVLSVRILAFVSVAPPTSISLLMETQRVRLWS